MDLNWLTFEENIRNYFRKLREDQRFFDVTLATDDGQHIQAHKVILSAGSHFFSDIFQKSNHTNMLVYLKGISSEKLEEVLDFIYNGEVSIGQEEIKVFIETGKELQVKGLEGELTGIGGNTADESNSFQDDNDPYYEDAEKEEDVDRESVEGLDTQATTVAQSRAGNIQANSHNELFIQVTEMIEKNEGVWKCKVCGKTSATKQSIKIHAETHIEGMSHACHLCSKTFPNRPGLQQHISNIHSELFSCDICGKTGMNRMGYMNHKSRKHKLSSV